MKKLVMMLALVGIAALVTSCNLLKGAGRDIEDVGDSIQDAAS